MKTKKIFLFISVIVVLGVGVYFGRQYYVRFLQAKQERLLYEARNTAWQQLEQRIKNEIIQFKGEAGIVVKDLETGWEFSYEKAKLFPSASLAKIPLMAACFLAADQGRIKLDRNIALKSADKLTGSGVLKDMPAGTTFSVQRLIGLMIYDSDNTATNIVTNLVGIGYLNSAFKAFGLKNTDLSRKIADYQSRDKGIENYTTAEDMSLLLEKIHRRTLGNKNVSDQCISMLKLTRMNDRIPKYLPAEITIAHKTGLERNVCHDAGIVFTRKGDFIVVVLTKHGNSNSTPSKEFIAKVSLHAYRYFEQLQ
ncbi:MAG: class A beta-lactamase-related serine hydrolase [Candidatus Omnitrophica bacterium]|nr:class A beta-lactamase-related serine hydrolase [Candidatus Omnitrophota bacterium]